MLKSLDSTTGQSQVQAMDAKEKSSRLVTLRPVMERGIILVKSRTHPSLARVWKRKN
jgi:hypothetical protein